MKIIKLADNNLNKAIQLAKQVLKRDGLVVVPSDTAYGLAARADSSKAVQKVLDFKGRLPDKGISVFLAKVDKITDYASCPQSQMETIQTLLPGPFTVILNSRLGLSSLLEPGDETLGVRVINYQFIQKLLKKTGFPFTATSANLSGKGPHYSIEAFLKTLSDKKKQMLDLVIDVGKLPRVPVSTVVRLVQDKIQVIRRGSLNPELIMVKKTGSAKSSQKLAQSIFTRFWQKELSTKTVVVILQGDFGVGKTVFAQGIGQLFGKQLVSPTFTLLDEYPINKKALKSLYHLDLFRIEDEAETEELKLGQFLKKGNLMLVEWGERLATFQNWKSPKIACYWLKINTKGETVRLFKLYKL
ncbi:L-threonylcarbamoyladenylate synthase [Patescibacteria group bacterium]